MREYLNSDTLYATLAMYLSECDELALVVEGDDDHLTLKDHCSEELRIFAGVGGKVRVLETAELAARHGLSRVKFLVDSDYDNYVSKTSNTSTNVLSSLHRDFFLDILEENRDLLLRIIDIRLDKVRRRPQEDLGVVCPEEVLSDAYGLATKLAAVRVMDARMGLALMFNRFSLASVPSLDMDVRSIAGAVIVRSGLKAADEVELLKYAETVHDEISSLSSAPVGDHDLFAALSRVLRKFGVMVKPDDLQRDFIISVRCDAIAKTAWYSEIEEWTRQRGKEAFKCSFRQMSAA